LFAALSLLDTRMSVVGLAFGAGTIPAEYRRILDVRVLGHIRDPKSLATVYSAADIFIMPSLEEVLGQTGIEAMACGTPVVAFAAGGIPDFVQPRETGLLAHVGDTAGLARQIAWLAEHRLERVRMGLNARSLIVREHAADAQAQKYIALYKSLTADRQDGGYRRSAA
jgi:glycosyltransferase involved in cell wall biosynthesis